MPVSHYTKPGISQRGRVKIMTCDPATRRVEGALKDGSLAQIAVWNVPSAFRWPQENEIWAIFMDTGVWHLGSRIQDGEITGTGVDIATGPETVPLESMAPGEMKLDSQVVIDSQGRTFIAIDLSTLLDGDTLRWSATLKQFVAGV